MTAVRFIHNLRFEDLPAEIVVRAKQCLLELVGVAAGGIGTDLSRIVRDHAARHMARARAVPRCCSTDAG